MSSAPASFWRVAKAPVGPAGVVEPPPPRVIRGVAVALTRRHQASVFGAFASESR